MTDVMMKLGSFAFSVDLAAYNQFRRATAYRWPAQERLNRQQTLQYVGPGEETVSLSGVYYPQVAGRYAIMDDLRAIAKLGKPQILVDGMGTVFGYFAIERVEDNVNMFMRAGVPKRVEFTIELRKFGDTANG